MLPVPATVETDDERRWHEERRLHVGASEVAALLGCHPWKTSLDVWGVKTGRIQDTASREEALWGQLLEDPIAREWSRRTGQEIVDHGRFAIRVHPTASHLAATLDREIVGPPPKALEIKTAERTHPDWRDGRAPLHQIVQVQAQLAVTGWESGVLACLVGRQLRVVHVERDDRLIDRMLEEVEDWWTRYVEADVEPPVEEWHLHSYDAIASLHPHDNGATIDLPVTLAPLVETWEEHTATKREAEKARDCIQAELCQAIGDATFARLPQGGRLSWKTQERTVRCKECGHEERSEFRVLRRLKK